MRSRVYHLAWLLVLLSSVGAADAAVRSSSTHLSGSAHYTRVLLAERRAASFASPAPVEPKASQTGSPDSAERAAWHAVWMMRPPAAHTLALQAVTRIRV